jgi:uncharacterized membrane protein YtjA (UPF0391 family)
MFSWSLTFLLVSIGAGFYALLAPDSWAAEIAKVFFFLFFILFVSLLAVGIERRFFSRRIELHGQHIRGLMI